MMRLVAIAYDRVMKGVEDGGLARWRADLLGDLSGDVLEVGSGTGRNLAHYPATVARLVLTEPDRHMRVRLLRAASRRRDTEIIAAAAENLPFDDASFDAVVCTLVLCSVDDPVRALDEVYRVLRPGGRLLFIEHVAALGQPRRLRWQHRLEPVWKRIAGNCHLTRTTEHDIISAGFELTDVQRASMRKAPPVVRPTVRGVARRRGN
jgi:ubiquinone/menaquinone biosynthesis C-methylase UbiE